jgi:pentatricopeptide repeat protein
MADQLDLDLCCRQMKGTQISDIRAFRIIKHFEWMCEEGVQPDDITFICLLSACSHAGLVDEGMLLYASMIRHYMIPAKLEHYTCMIDLLGHVGCLQEAENMIMGNAL